MKAEDGKAPSFRGERRSHMKRKFHPWGAAFLLGAGLGILASFALSARTLAILEAAALVSSCLLFLLCLRK